MTTGLFRGLQSRILTKDSIQPLASLVRHKSALSSNIVDKTTNEKFTKKWISYWVALLKDYQQVAKDSVISMKDNPAKSCFYGILFGCAFGCVYNNPDENDYLAAVIENNNKIILVGEKQRNIESENHIKSVESLFNKKLIERINFGLFSLIVKNYKSENVCLYAENCEYLQPSYFDILKNDVLDFGFLGHWYVLDERMINYDVNDEEWID